jgi:peroxiredoxin (alkyl hydroperoxide reductase subunit C)
MLTIGDRLPSFKLQSVVSIELGQEFAEITDHTHQGKWKLLFAWPMDFTFVCPTEIAAFGARTEEFEERDCQVLGMSTDTQFVHLAWRKQHPDLKSLPFPMLADTKRELSVALGILHREEGVPLRASFLVDPQNVIRWVCVNDLKVGRSVDEALRVLDALQTDELCPCNWKPGQKTLEVA